MLKIKALVLILYLNAAFSERQKIPVDWIKANQLPKLPCNEDLNLGEVGCLRFQLDSKDECYSIIPGSPDCTPTVFCDGYAGFQSLDDGGTRDNFFKLSDEKAGEIKGYGNFHFDGNGYYPKEGIELSIDYKGIASSELQCVLFCKEDVTKEHKIKVNPLPPMPPK